MPDNQTMIAASFHSKVRFFTSVILCSVLAFALGPRSAHGQNGLQGFDPTNGTRPPLAYYQALEIYRMGDLPNANQAFELAMGQTTIDINGRRIESIPIYAMLAECQWHLGDVDQAKQFTDKVFELVVRHRGWLRRVQWDSVLLASGRARPPGLWPAATAVNQLPVSSRMSFSAGTMLNSPQQLIGTIDESPNVKMMDIVEIVRGVAIASYRRRMILGPLAAQDPLLLEALDATKFPAGLQIPVARAIIGSMRATERFANGEDPLAIETAVQYGLVNNAVHPVSPLTGLCQASALAGSPKPEAAIPVATSVMNAAASLGQYEYVGEALQLAAGCATPQQASVIRGAAATASTAMLRRSRLATLHCLLAGADAGITAGELDAAQVMLNQAQTLAARRDVVQPRLDAYGGYVAARLAAAKGGTVGITKPTEVDQALARMREFALNRKRRNRPVVSMPRIYQLGIIRSMMGKQLGGKSSDKLLASYCDQPPADLWRRDAVDALSSLMIDRSAPHAARLEIAVASKDHVNVLARSDEFLAHRFHRRLALGGRITQVRALARSDDSLLPPEVVELRNAAPAAFKSLRASVAEPIPADKDELAARAARLEAQATLLALSRTPLPQIMLPPISPKTAIAKMPPRTGLLTFVNIGSLLHVTLVAEGKVEYWTVGGVGRVPAEIKRLLRAVGVGRARGKRLPEDEQWRTIATTLRRHLFPDDVTISTDRFDRLVIVPDQSLWYLPFELLPLGDEDSPLIGDKIKVRYAATPGLAFQPTATKSRSRVVGISSGKFFAPRDPDLNEAIVQSLADSVNESIRLPADLNVPSNMLADSAGHLVVMAPTVGNLDRPFSMNVAAYDQTTAAGTLAAWMRFPAKTPESVVLSGYQTAADKSANLGSGDEIFLAICGLQSAGVRNVMLSRWVVGGESTSIALNEFLQELPFSGMQASWCRARAVLRRTELNPMAEPLLTQSEHELEELSGNEPFFWSGYLVAAPFGESELNASPKP